MRQHPIDLLPDSIRIRNQAGVITGRYVVATIFAVIVVVLGSVHFHVRADHAGERLEIAEEQANLVLQAEAEAQQLRLRLQALDAFVDRYREVAPPLELSRVLATIVNQLPPGTTLDQMSMYGRSTSKARSSRSRGMPQETESPPRLNGEISGFAVSDNDVAEIVTLLDGMSLFEHVSLDFIRTRPVRGYGAREFRISFRIGLEQPFDVVDGAEIAGKEVAHVR